MGVQRAAGELTTRPTHRTLAGSGSRLDLITGLLRTLVPLTHGTQRQQARVCYGLLYTRRCEYAAISWQHDGPVMQPLCVAQAPRCVTSC